MKALVLKSTCTPMLWPNASSTLRDKQHLPWPYYTVAMPAKHIQQTHSKVDELIILTGTIVTVRGCEKGDTNNQYQYVTYAIPGVWKSFDSWGMVLIWKVLWTHTVEYL